MERELTDYEQKLLKQLLAKDFEGKGELSAQLSGLKVAPLNDKDNYGSILLKPQGGKAALTTQRVPVEGEYVDSDGVPVSILLHVSNGYLHELEIFKADGLDILSLATKLRVEIR